MKYNGEDLMIDVVVLEKIAQTAYLLGNLST